MYQITLNNGKSFTCDENTTILDAAKSNNIVLEHSCLTARCRSCVVQIIEGETFNKQDELVLSDKEKMQNFVLSCNAVPKTNLELDIEDLGNVELFEKKVVPAKVKSIDFLTANVIKVILRLPPTAKFKFNSGQYVNLIKGNIKRSYSLANTFEENANLVFFIKKYEGGAMSNYWFNQAKLSDLLRVEGPLGTFFLRETTKKNIVFLATGTGIAPIKAILENIDRNQEKFSDKTFWLFFGARYKEDLFWKPNTKNINLVFVPVISRKSENWEGFTGYIQDAVLEQEVDLTDAQVYACGSNLMIESAKSKLIQNKLPENQFFSDAFVQTN